MYYPQSKILENQYADENELVYKNTKEPYQGPYHILADGKIYTGKNPRDGQLLELEYSNNVKFSDDAGAFSSLTPTQILKNTQYDAIRQRVNIKPPASELIEPKYSEPSVQYPSFTRYFLRRTNNVIFTEVNQIDYNAIKIKDPKYNFGIYIPFELPWTTSGANIAEINQKITLLTEKRFKVYGLSKYITDYTKFSI